MTMTLPVGLTRFGMAQHRRENASVEHLALAAHAAKAPGGGAYHQPAFSLNNDTLTIRTKDSASGLPTAQDLRIAEAIKPGDAESAHQYTVTLNAYQQSHVPDGYGGRKEAYNKVVVTGHDLLTPEADDKPASA